MFLGDRDVFGGTSMKKFDNDNEKSTLDVLLAYMSITISRQACPLARLRPSLFIQVRADSEYQQSTSVNHKM